MSHGHLLRAETSMKYHLDTMNSDVKTFDIKCRPVVVFRHTNSFTKEDKKNYYHIGIGDPLNDNTILAPYAVPTGKQVYHVII